MRYICLFVFISLFYGFAFFSWTAVHTAVYAEDKQRGEGQLEPLEYYKASAEAAASEEAVEKEENKISENQWVLRGGVAMSATAFEAYSMRVRPKQFHFGWSFASQMGYKWSNLELSFSSYCTISDVQAQRLEVGNSVVESKEVDLLDATFGPKVRYYLPLTLPQTKWVPYGTASWLVGLMTLKFEEGHVSGDTVAIHHKLAYEGQGFLLGIGIESRNLENDWGWFNQINSHLKELYYEVVYKYMKATKVSVITGPKTEVHTIHTEDRNCWVKEHTFMLVVGIKIF